ncbi:septum formation initiator [Kineosporia sp. NBRC 101677]|uniref:septum site-determining protein Ssd n=1 Tax=Kineosporia sp. NBRC 101677 TaxID=3032197 RepID=UPI0024A5DA9A|nr:septum site-determining protein Ssd [Kineosporia sp. NBRC 101677]GLY14189.1 septum formation initiator [Kineosporia sp. NBRC 101677]
MVLIWVLLLTAEPLLTSVVERLAGAQGVRVVPSVPGSAPGPPALVLVGADHDVSQGLPALASGVPRLLLATGDPDERLWRGARDLRAEQVVLLPEGEHRLQERLARLGEARRGARTVGVIGGCGGAGASVLAAALARTAAITGPALLIEMDQAGGGADLLLGAEDEPGLRWPDLGSARGRLLPGSLSGSLPLIDGLHVLAAVRSGPVTELSAPAVGAVLEAARAEFGTVVLDLPRHLDEATSAAVRALGCCLVLVPAAVRAVASAQRLTAGLRPLVGDLRAVVRGPTAAGLGPSGICAALGLPSAGLLRVEPGLKAGLDRGEPPGLRARGPLARFCRDLLERELAGVRG